MKNIFYSLICLLVGILPQGCQNSNETENSDETEKEVIGQFKVDFGDVNRVESVVSIALDGITFLPDSDLSLYEIVGKERVKTDVQFEISGNKRYLYWILQADSTKNSNRQYELVSEKSIPVTNEPPVSIINQNGIWQFSFNGKKVLNYNSQVVQPPKGVDSSFKRSGFINPIYAPNQELLTRVPDSNSDHLHHYGLWNAWKKVQFKGETIDFFAPQFGQGTIRHVGVISKNEGPVFSNLKVLREHITWQDTERETMAMSDLMDIKVFNNQQGWYLIDLSFQYNPVEPFLIEEYRYAGFSFRATDNWTKNNTNFYTSEGLDRDQADGERSEWCVVTGETPKGPVSMQFMSHPGNFNHPEPMRIWPSDGGTGHVFINFSPTRNTNWLLSPGQSYLLRYRLLITDGSMKSEEAERSWNEFSNPVKVNFTKNEN